MSADQIARISPMVRKVFESPSEGMCATFEIVGKRDAWAQVMKGTLNAAYPLENPPESHLRDILGSLPGAIVTDWKAKSFVTVMFDSATPSDVAKAIDGLFERLFGVGDYSVDGRLEDL
jgi:hypothetical protein